MIIHCVWEHNGPDTLLYAIDFPGAFARGASLDEAMDKMPAEIVSYCRWLGNDTPENIQCEVTQEQTSTLMIRDADSDVLFDAERPPLTHKEYEYLKRIALQSARDFQALYDSIPAHHQSCLAPRKTFYSQIPRTAQEMYLHTRDVNTYYFGEIGVEADREGDIAGCRERGFAILEQKPDYLLNAVYDGSYDEQWTLRKVLRRFLWHDRIHARAMWRMANKTFPGAQAANPFEFEHAFAPVSYKA